MRKKLQDQVVVVTGASSGIGRATALALADAGAVVIGVARRQAAVEDVADACRERAGTATGVVADVADAEALRQVADDVVGRHGRLDAWVNNAAVNLFGPLEEVPVEAWHRVIETNLLGTYHGLRAALPWMREQGRGVIVNVASVLSEVPVPQQSAYVVSKHAIAGLSGSIRQELAELPDVQVCTVHPGPIDTPLFRSAANHAGREVVPLTPVIDAHRVADAIVGCIRSPQRKVVVGAIPTGVTGLSRLLPGSVERAARRQVEQDHFSDRMVPATDGNLFEPDGREPTVSGGWSHSGEQVGASSGRAASSGTGGSARKVVALVGAVGTVGALCAAALRRGSG